MCTLSFLQYLGQYGIVTDVAANIQVRFDDGHE